MDLSQEERVMQHQIAIAEAMKVKPEILQILQKVGKWEIREWLYICAVDGMDYEQIRQLAEKSVTVADIREIRRKRLTDNQLVTGLHALEEEVRTACQENKSVRAVIEKKRNNKKRININ